jgi:hypothetical protein
MVHSQFPGKSCRRNLCVNLTLLVTYHIRSYSNPPKHNPHGWSHLVVPLLSHYFADSHSPVWPVISIIAVGAYSHGQVHIR